MYYALKGQAGMRAEVGIEEFKAGATAIYPPGDAHQIINESSDDS